METLEAIVQRIADRFSPEAATIVPNPGPAAQASLLVPAALGRAVAEFLRDDPQLRLDYCSNVTGVDWPQAGYLEAVYHFYSMTLRQGPLVVRMRTGDRASAVTLPSLTPVWRSAEFQEREIFDLYGIVFEGHPDLRRLLMWDEFVDHPMRKDYAPPETDPLPAKGSA